MNRRVGALRWIIRQVFREAVVPVPGEAKTALWMRPSEYPILLAGPRRVEPDILREWAVLLRPNDVIFDVGANIGFTVQRFYGLLEGRCRIWAFEPLPRNVDLLERNVRNLQGKVTVIGSAVGDRSGRVVLTDNRQHGGLSRLRDLRTRDDDNQAFWQDVEEIEVPMVTLDEFIATSSEIQPTFLKIDVEGAGHWVAHGAVQLLKHYKPVVSCSFHSEEEREGILSVLAALGYRGIDIDRAGSCWWCDLDDAPRNFVHPDDARASGFSKREQPAPHTL